MWQMAWKPFEHLSEMRLIEFNAAPIGGPTTHFLELHIWVL